MRIALAFLLPVAACSCTPPQTDAKIDTLEIRQSGLEISLNSDGIGHYRLGDRLTFRPGPEKAFRIPPPEFDRILARLSQFRRKSGLTEPTEKHYLNSNCAPNLPYVTDAGSISIRWRGRGQDQIYIVDLGCDYKRNAESNRQLASVLKSLPVPDPLPLP